MDATEARDVTARLAAKVVSRRADLKVWRDYYRGDHPRPYVPADRAAEYQRLLDRAKANFMAPVVDIVAERLRVSGLNSTQPGLAQDLWAVWQASKMDARQVRLFRNALSLSLAYLTVVERDGRVLLRTESPMRMMHETDPADPDRLTYAATFWGEDDERFARLFTPLEWIDLRQMDGVWKIQSAARHRVGSVPVQPVMNLPDDEGGCRSELDGLTSIQDRINQTLADRLMAQTFGAHRQRLIMGWVPEEDENGNPVWPFRPGVNRTWTIEESDAKVAEFSETQLGPYLSAIETDLKTLAAVSRRPAPYLLGGDNPPSAEALQAAEKSGMSSVVSERKTDFGEDVESALNLVARAMGRATDDSLEVVWQDLEPHSEGARVDAAVKKASNLMVPFVQVWRELGYSPQQIAEFPSLMNQFRSASEAPSEPSARELSVAEMVQKLYLGVGKAIFEEEARQILADAGADIDPGESVAVPPAE